MNMDIVTTSLEALIQRATCNQNQCPDTAAIDAFCGLISKEPDCAQTATRFITAKVHSLQEWEALQALHVLDACMKRCGSSFHAEVGKFRFLNELIKLVSPKYNGAHTPEPVKRRVLELMQSWTIYYPREFKIKEAYEMLKKQGVVKEEMFLEAHKSLDQNIEPPPPRHQDSIFQDTEKSRLLQKLLQSKNPDDLQAANRLIKTMVKEDERRVEMKSKHLSELEAAHNNARLLSEMLDSYSKEVSSLQDLELIKELQASCLRFRPNVQKLLSEVHKDERLFNEVLAANDELGEVLEKYSVVIVQGLPPSAVGGNLLDLSSPICEKSLPTPAPVVSLLCDQLSAIDMHDPIANSMDTTLPLPLTSAVLPPKPPLNSQPLGDLASLGDIFSSITPSAPLHVSPIRAATEKPVPKTGLEELDAISMSLLKQNLPHTLSQPPVKPQTKVPMNQLPLSHHASPIHSNLPQLHSTSSPLHSTPAPPPIVPSEPLDLLIGSEDPVISPQVNGDTLMVDITPEGKLTEIKTDSQTPVKNEGQVKPLGDITVPLESIKPGSLPPLTVVEERGVAVTIHFAQDSPRPDVSVFVVTTTSKSQFLISDYLFQAIVPKGCRLRLQPPSSTELPAHNPFLPPAAITQVMLIASPNKEPILLRVVVSFTMDDETVTEMKEVEKFPLLNS